MTRDEKEKHLEKQLEEILVTLDDTEKTVMLYTIMIVVEAKSKGWRTRRLNDFARWLDVRRAAINAASAA